MTALGPKSPHLLDAAPVEGPAAGPAEVVRDGRYGVVGVLGSGSQGETLAAVDKRVGRLVAIKRFTIRGAKSWKDVELAEREANVLASLSHPNLPRYIEHFEENGALYLVMEKVEGESLAKRRKRGAALDQQQVLRFLRETGECLRYLHGHAPPIVHRDIKPGNVILRPDGSYCLVDFGSVRDRLKPEGGSTVVGTFGFMAPEQFQGRAAPASDVYATAATALCLLTGNEPEDLPHKGLAIDVDAALRGHADRRLIGALRSMLEPDPDRRESSVAAALSRNGLGPEQNANEPSTAQAAKRARRARLEAEAEGKWPGSERDWYEAPDEATRRTVRAAHREAKREARRAERYGRRARRAHGASDHWHRPGRPVPPGIVLGLFILMALRVASVATFALFQVLLPTLFTLLSVLVGSRMQERARRMSELGRIGQRGLERAGEHIRYQLMGGATPAELEREASDDASFTPPTAEAARGPAPRQRVSIDAEADELGGEQAEAADNPHVSKR
ncbi:MAG TPA: serine/threonine-protein kinase [Polyangiaceae bacterium]